MKTRFGNEIADNAEKKVYITKEEKDKNQEIFMNRLGELMGKLTVVEFSNKLGMSDKVIHSYLSGYRFPNGHVVKRIAEKCGVTADWILGVNE